LFYRYYARQAGLIARANDALLQACPCAGKRTQSEKKDAVTYFRQSFASEREKSAEKLSQMEF